MKRGIAVRWDSLFPTVGEYDGFEDIQRIVGGYVEHIPYPTQLKRPGLVVFADENGIRKPLPYNRWGLVGIFVIVKMSRDGRFIPMSDSEMEAVIYDLRDSSGYLDPQCEVESPFREPFAKYGVPPQGYIPEAGCWFR
jgi:hypothetical protein